MTRSRRDSDRDSDRDRDRDPAGRARNSRPRDDLGRPLARDASGHQPHDAPALPPADALRTAQRLLAEGRPFTAHEVLEAVWKATDGQERELWRGLAQLAVGVTHVSRGNPKGARALLDRAADSLAPFAGSQPYGVDVDRLRAWAQEPSAQPLPPLTSSGLPDPG